MSPCLEFLSAPVAVMSVMQHETSLKPYTYSWDTFETLLKVLWHNLVTSLYHLVIYLKQTVKNRITMKHHKKNPETSFTFFCNFLEMPIWNNIETFFQHPWNVLETPIKNSSYIPFLETSLKPSWNPLNKRSPLKLLWNTLKTSTTMVV